MPEHEIRRFNLCRPIRSTELRTGADGAEEGDVLFGEFARFNEWTEINSPFEGRFLERIVPGAFNRMIDQVRADPRSVKVLYDHGQNPAVGNSQLGLIRSVEAVKTGVAYEVDMVDTSYNRDIIKPQARAGLLGASFRFSARSDTWVDPPKATPRNPERLPERSLEDLDVFEFSAVNFPAYAGATAGMRASLTDDWLSRIYRYFQEDPERVFEFAEESSFRVAEETVRAAKEALLLQPVTRSGINVSSARVALLEFS